MIYNDDAFTKRSTAASLLSVKADLNHKIGRVSNKYAEIYESIVAESNGLVNFLNEFRVAVNTIVNDCNDLQGLTDEELTEIQQRIEELKSILDSVEIPDLPELKKPEDIFIGSPNNCVHCDDAENGAICDAEYSCVSGFCSIGVGVQISGTSPLPGKEGGTAGGNNATTFGCYGYTVIHGESGICYKNYIVWGNCTANDGICVRNYDQELDQHCGLDYNGQYSGCLSNYEDENYKCDGDFMIHMCVYHDDNDNGDSCGLGYMSSTVTCDYMYDKSTGSAGQCMYNYSTCEENVGDAPTITCEESYFTTDIRTTEGEFITCIGYGTQDQNCPRSFQVAFGSSSCNSNFEDGNTECKTHFQASNDSNVSACIGGFKDDTHNCPSNWSYGLGKNACNINYSNESVTCAKGYITDGVNTWCDLPDGACGSCQLGYCSPANYTSCSYCPSYSPSCGESEPCEEGEHPCAWPPPCDEGEPCGESEPCYQEPTCQPCVDIIDTCSEAYSCSNTPCDPCLYMFDNCTGVCNVIRHGGQEIPQN